MLAQIVEMLHNPKGSKYLAVVVETSEGSFDGFNGLGVMDITVNKIAKFNEITHSANHFSRYMTLNCGQVHLHEGLGVVSCPLLESPALRETPQPREWGNSSDSA